MTNIMDLEAEIEGINARIRINEAEGIRLQEYLLNARRRLCDARRQECRHERGFFVDAPRQEEYCPLCYLTRDTTIGVG